MSALGAPHVHTTYPNSPSRGVTHAAALHQDDTTEVGRMPVDNFKKATTHRAMFASTSTRAEVGWVSLADLYGSTTPRGMFPTAFELSSNTWAPLQEDTSEGAISSKTWAPFGWISFDELKRSTTPHAKFPDTDTDKSTTASELSSNRSTPLSPSIFGLTDDLVEPKLENHTAGSGVQSCIHGDSQPCVDEHQPLGPKAAWTATTLTPQVHSKAELLFEGDGEEEACSSSKRARDEAQANSHRQTHKNEAVQDLAVTHHEDQWEEVIESPSVAAHVHSNVTLPTGESCAQQKAACLDVPDPCDSEHCFALSLLRMEALQVVKSWFALAGFSTWPASTVCKQLMMREELRRTIVDSWFALGPSLGFHELYRPTRSTHITSVWMDAVDSWFALGPALDFHELPRPASRTHIIAVRMDTIGMEQVWSVADETPSDRSRLAEASEHLVDSWFGLD